MYIALYPNSYNDLFILDGYSIEWKPDDCFPVLDTKSGGVDIISFNTIYSLAHDNPVQNLYSKGGKLFVRYKSYEIKYKNYIDDYPQTVVNDSDILNYTVYDDKIILNFQSAFNKNVTLEQKSEPFMLERKKLLWVSRNNHVRFLYAFYENGYIFCRFKYGELITQDTEEAEFMRFSDYYKRECIDGICFTLIFDVYGHPLACCVTGKNTIDSWKDGVYVGDYSELNTWSVVEYLYNFTGFDNMPTCSLASKLRILGGGNFVV